MAKSTKTEGFTEDEREAMKERAKEAKRGSKADGEADLLAKVAEMTGSDKTIAERLHGIIKEVAPGLKCKTWYGMPAYTNADGKVICFFQAAAKFKVRYATLGFQEDAKLDDGEMWPTAYALKALGAAEEARIVALLKKAVG